MSNNSISGIILLQDEPEGNVIGKWAAWLLVMIIFLMVLIYVSNYFSKNTECFSAKHTGILGRDNLLSRWMSKNAYRKWDT